MSKSISPQFSIDLARCIGCKACSVACKDRAGLPDEVDWLRVEAYEGGTYPTPTLVYRVVHCFHCADPACVASCPTGAMAQDVDGWVQVDASLCIACGACVEACPNGALQLKGYSIPSGDVVARAARMKPENSGCPSRGLEVNSGWNWHPRYHGCFVNSMISTKSPDGDIPLKTMPLSINFSLNALLNS